MSLDLESLLRDWPHEPGQIKVRKIRGDNGDEKLQMRLDLGLIQMNLEGRPDGVRPHACESLLEYFLGQAAQAESAGQEYSMGEDDCAELQQEAIQYYHRYVALFQLEDFEGVVRDTQHNLDIFDLMEKCADQEEAAGSLQQVRPYVIMMNTRALASMELERENFAAAVERIEAGMAAIAAFYEARGQVEMTTKSQEMAFLTEWLDEVRSRKPMSEMEKLEREMNDAIANEAYEKAAEIRDAIRQQRSPD